MNEAKARKAADGLASRVKRAKARLKEAKDPTTARATRKRIKRAQRKRRLLLAAAGRSAAKPAEATAG